LERKRKEVGVTWFARDKAVAFSTKTLFATSKNQLPAGTVQFAPGLPVNTTLPFCHKETMLG
jgi:hypothetical protein